MQYPLDLEKIRDILPESYEQVWDTVMNEVTQTADLQMDKIVGPRKRRIGVFGPYTEKEKQIMYSICEIICKNNYIAITGDGAYVPDACYACMPAKMYLPSVMEKTISKFNIPDYIRFQHFPRLVSRAINLLEPARTQRNEAEGCYRFGIPMIGMIIHSSVGSESEGLCNYIQDYTAYQECMCPEKELCLYLAIKPKCPFYDYVNIPWAMKQLFMTRVNRLVAMKEVSNMEVVVTEYVINKMTKPSVWEKSGSL